MRAALAIPLVLALVLVQPAQGALNGPLPYAGTIPYAHFAAMDNITFLSGKVEIAAIEGRGAYAFFNTTGAHIDGLTRVCWLGGCATSPEGHLSVVMLPGASVGMQLPAPSTARLTASHGLALFADFQGQKLNQVALGRTVIAAVQDGAIEFQTIRPIPDNAQPSLANSGIVAATDSSSHLLVRDGAVPIKSLDGVNAGVFFQGSPKLPKFHSEMVAMPTEPGSTAHFERAEPTAAAKGISTEGIGKLLEKFQLASGGSAHGNGPLALIFSSLNVSALEPIMAGIFNGAVVQIPIGADGLDILRKLVLVRFESMDAVAGANTISLKGEGILQLNEGRVAGASPLVGFAVLQAPWWSFGIWILAIAAFICVLVFKPAKEHARWDRFNWVGWVAGPLTIILVAFLWDSEVKAVWGVSLLSGGMSGTAMGIVAALEILPALALLLIIVTPLRILFRAGLRLLKQGKFMGLSRPLALLVGYFVCAGLMRTYLDLVLRQALGT